MHFINYNVSSPFTDTIYVTNSFLTPNGINFFTMGNLYLFLLQNCINQNAAQEIVITQNAGGYSILDYYEKLSGDSIHIYKPYYQNFLKAR